MQKYPKPEDTIELLVTAAKKAAKSNGGQHPEDIAMAMMSAIEFSWPVVLEAYEKFYNA